MTQTHIAFFMEEIMMKRKQIQILMVFCILGICLIYAFTQQDRLINSAWALFPAVTAIALALVTKEVYSSLFIGILSGAVLLSGFNFEKTLNSVFDNGIVSVLSDSENIGILIFLVILGIMVNLMNASGGSKAFGIWVGKHVKSRVKTQLMTIFLGMLIFIDDYFNCLTVGSVMRPVCDQKKISRAKLAYLIDATAAPICIIAPISSWAAAVSGFVEGEDGFSIFLQTIPYNFYALLTIAMLLMITIMKVDYGAMAKYEKKAEQGISAEEDIIVEHGHVYDLLFPIISLMICCIIGMLYSGGFFQGVDFVTAFSQSQASVGLVYGSFCSLILTIGYYMLRKILSFNEIVERVPKGFVSMVPAILILVFAWTLKEITMQLGAATFVSEAIQNWNSQMLFLLPSIIFIIAALLAFATGTSWGTFGILIPIVVSIFQQDSHTMMILSISACMAGAVCGDHCSPISDTTIMASAGAECDHVVHVETQLPYVLPVALVSFICYLFAAVMKTPWIPLVTGIILLFGFLWIIRKVQNAKQK